MTPVGSVGKVDNRSVSSKCLNLLGNARILLVLGCIKQLRHAVKHNVAVGIFYRCRNAASRSPVKTSRGFPPPNTAQIKLVAPFYPCHGVGILDTLASGIVLKKL